MKRFFCAFFVLLLIFSFVIPVSAEETGDAECLHDKYPGAIPVGAVMKYKPIDWKTHACYYVCDTCGEEITFSTNDHYIHEYDVRCDCGITRNEILALKYEEEKNEACKHEKTEIRYDKHVTDAINYLTKHIKYTYCPDCEEYIHSEEEDHAASSEGVCVYCFQEGIEVDPPIEVPPVEEPPIEEPPVEVPPAEEPPAEIPTDNTAPSGEEDQFIISQFFEEKILPLIISAGSAFLMFLGAITPALKNSGKYKRLQGIYSATKAENAKYVELLLGTDIEKFKETVESILTDDLKKKIAELGNFEPKFDEMSAKMELLFAQMQAMKEGAINAWAQSPAAVAALTASPTESAVLRLVQQNKAFEGYIKEQKGDEAAKIIAELKGESENDEQGNVPSV